MLPDYLCDCSRMPIDFFELFQKDCCKVLLKNDSIERGNNKATQSGRFYLMCQYEKKSALADIQGNSIDVRYSGAHPGGL